MARSDATESWLRRLIWVYTVCKGLPVELLRVIMVIWSRDDENKGSNSVYYFLSHLLVAGCDIGIRFSVRPSVRLPIRLSTFMSNFNIYVKVSILINYKTKQPSNLAWNISLTSWLRHRHPLFRLSVCPFVCLFISTFMSKFDIYVKVSILINYKTKQPSTLAWNISLTSWLCDLGIPFPVHLSVRPSVHLNIYVEVRHFHKS